MSVFDFNFRRSTDYNSDEEPESFKITIRALENLVASGKLVELLFKNKKFREKITELVLATMHSEKQNEAIWVCFNNYLMCCTYFLAGWIEPRLCSSWRVSKRSNKK